jgi:glucose-6-phosphate 1-dehydrogenase
MDGISVRQVLEVVGDFDDLGGAGPGLVAWELSVEEERVAGAWEQMLADGLLTPAGRDKIHGVPFYLRTGKRMAEGQRIVSIAFREAPKSMFPAGSGVGSQGPDHLTFDLADASRLSLSFYGKRPGPGMHLDKLSMQFATGETEQAADVLEAYERLLLDVLRGDHTLFTTAEGIESLWERSAPLLEEPPPVKTYKPGTWGPNAIHQLIAPHAWRLPFERVWREHR